MWRGWASLLKRLLEKNQGTWPTPANTKYVGQAILHHAALTDLPPDCSLLSEPRWDQQKNLFSAPGFLTNSLMDW